MTRKNIKQVEGKNMSAKKENQESNSVVMASYSEAKQFAIANKIKSFKAWESFDRPGNMPAEPKNFYKEDWVDSYDFFGKNRPSAKGGKKSVVYLAIDAGNGNVKAANSDGEIVFYPSVITFLDCRIGAVSGLFKAKGLEKESDVYYHTGDVSDSVSNHQGRLIVRQYPNGKVVLFPLLAMGALARMPKALGQAKKIKGEKNKRLLRVSVEALTLADAGNEVLQDSLARFTEFEYEGIVYVLEWTSVLTYREGMGSAIMANNFLRQHHKHIKKFMLADLGEGTFSQSFWEVRENTIPQFQYQIPYSAGVSTLLREFSSKSKKAGDGRSLLRNNHIRKALERSSYDTNAKKYKAPAYVIQDLGDSLLPALSTWKVESGIDEMLMDIGEYLLDGGFLFLCGGGLEIKALQHYFFQEIFKGYASQIFIVPNPGRSNLDGLVNKSLTVEFNEEVTVDAT